MKTRIPGLLLIALVAAGSASAQTLAFWNFNTPDNNPGTGTAAPALGTGTIAPLGTTADFHSAQQASMPNPNSGDPTVQANDSAYRFGNFPSQNQASGTEGVRFAVSTVGFQDIIVNWDQNGTNNASRNTRLDYTTDGTTWTPFATFQSTNTSWYNGRSVNLSAIAAVENNPNFGFRLVSVFEAAQSYYQPIVGDQFAYGSNGWWAVDMVTITATAIPEPSTYAALLGCAIFPFVVRLRRHLLNDQA